MGFGCEAGARSFRRPRHRVRVRRLRRALGLLRTVAQALVAPGIGRGPVREIAARERVAVRHVAAMVGIVAPLVVADEDRPVVAVVEVEGPRVVQAHAVQAPVEVAEEEVGAHHDRDAPRRIRSRRRSSPARAPSTPAPRWATTSRRRRRAGRSTGRGPDGVPYRALDPELVAWVHTCIPWMILRAYDRTKRRLTVAEKNPTWPSRPSSAGWGSGPGADYRRRTRRLRRDMRPKLSVNAQTRESIDFLMTAPFSPFGVSLPASVDRKLHRFAIYAGMSRAPRWARELIGYDRPPWMTSRLIEPQLAARREAPAMGVRHAALRRAGPGAEPNPLLRWRHVDGRRTRGACAHRNRRGSARCDGPDLRAHSRCSGVGGGTRWPATDHRRGCGPACGGVEDDGIPSVSAARRPRGGPGAARDTAVPGRGRHRVDGAPNPRDGVAAAFIAAVQFSRAHPMLRRAGQTDSALSAADMTELIAAGSAFIAEHVGSAVPGYSSADTESEAVQQVQWVSDVFARLFLTYISWPPSDPDFDDDAELRRFAHEILTPMVDRLAR